MTDYTARLLSSLDQARAESVVALRAQYDPHPQEDRRLILVDVSDGRTSTVLDIRVPTDSLEALEQEFQARGIRVGCSDAMYRTAWRYAWVRIGRQLRIWRAGRGAVAVANRCGLTLVGRRWMGRSCAFLPTAIIARIHADVSACWDRHDVCILDIFGGRHRLASKRESGPWIDITYDGLDLIADAGWSVDLAEALSEALGVTRTLHPDLQ